MDRGVYARLAAYRRTKAEHSKQESDVPATDGSHDGSETEATLGETRTKEAEHHSPALSQSAPTPWYILVLKAILWLLLWGLFIELEFGVVFLVASALYFMYVSLRGSRRKSGEPSAYSVFNKNFEAIEGTLSAEQFEKELRFGATSVRKPKH